MDNKKVENSRLVVCAIIFLASTILTYNSYKLQTSSVLNLLSVTGGSLLKLEKILWLLPLSVLVYPFVHLIDRPIRLRFFTPLDKKMIRWICSLKKQPGISVTQLTKIVEEMQKRRSFFRKVIYPIVEEHEDTKKLSEQIGGNGLLISAALNLMLIPCLVACFAWLLNAIFETEKRVLTTPLLVIMGVCFIGGATAGFFLLRRHKELMRRQAERIALKYETNVLQLIEKFLK